MASELLPEVLERYRSSGDFNGLYIHGTDRSRVSDAVDLVRAGLLQVVAEEDYPNPHIRPWPSRRSVDEQVASLEALPTAAYGLCLYPTPEALAQNPDGETYPDEPYRRCMAEGRGTLELAYFRFEVLEQYRNDPRYRFRFDDFGADAVIGDDAYLDDAEPEHDKVIMGHIGFAYDLTGYDRDDPESPIVRRVCAFYGDLAKLSDLHQQRWKTYQVDDDEVLKPHPVWWGQQMGHWPDGLGPFERLVSELEALNELHQRAFGADLFHHTERPDDFGWILRPSQHDWDDFVLALDKLLSDNLSHDGLTAAGVPRQDDAGTNMGTIVRLSRLLESRGIAQVNARAALAPMREVRQARQAPAHALRQNVTDRTLVHKQVALMDRVTDMVRGLREFWQRHPANADWDEPDYLAETKGYRM